MKYFIGAIIGIILGSLWGEWVANQEYSVLFSWVVMEQYTLQGAIFGGVVGLVFVFFGSR